MAIDGPGNFDSDGAYDTLITLLDELVKTIRTTFTLDSETSLYDDVGEYAIMANIDIILTLCEHYDAVPFMQEKEVLKWKEDYLDTFDRTRHEYNWSTDLVEKRRVVIIETFDRLHQFLKKANNRQKDQTEE
jgi:hypothetical protein